jgi:hypothetical protein
MPLFFWFPMIIMGGMLDVAADRAARSSGRDGPTATRRQAPRTEQGPMQPGQAYARARGWPKRATKTMPRRMVPRQAPHELNPSIEPLPGEPVGS